MRKSILLLFVLILSVATAAETFEPREIVSELSENKELVNASIEQMEIPETLKQLFGNETTNVFIEMQNGTTETVGVKTKNAKIEEIVYNGLEEPTLKVYTSEETIMEIMDADEPIDAVVDALAAGKIRHEGTDLVSAIKFGFIGIIQRIISFFLGLFGIA